VSQSGLRCGQGGRCAPNGCGGEAGPENDAKQPKSWYEFAIFCTS
jgi:hypothetical protein